MQIIMSPMQLFVAPADNSVTQQMYYHRIQQLWTLTSSNRAVSLLPVWILQLPDLGRQDCVELVGQHLRNGCNYCYCKNDVWNYYYCCFIITILIMNIIILMANMIIWYSNSTNGSVKRKVINVMKMMIDCSNSFKPTNGSVVINVR